MSDAGAYSCEAMNTLGTTFSVPETFVTIRDCSKKVTSPPQSNSSEIKKEDNCNCNLHSTICTCSGRCVVNIIYFKSVKKKFSKFRPKFCHLKKK